MTFVPHPLRSGLSEELHSRPSPELEAPCVVAHLALHHPPEDEGFVGHLADLARRYGAPPPHHDRHYAADMGTFRIRFEQHTEFASLTLIRPLGAEDKAFARSGLSLLPGDWLESVSACVIEATHFVLLPAGTLDEPGAIAGLLEGQRLLGGRMRDGLADVTTALKEDGRGFTRYLLHVHKPSPERLGRLVQRLIELDTYRMMALLALPDAKRIAPELTDLNQRLAGLVTQLEAADDLASETAMLNGLFALANAAERLKAQSGFRFSATRAYAQLVQDRIASLGEERLGDRQRLGEFLGRRFEPAMRTCRSVEDRIESLGRNIARTADLARTRVDLALERQNRDLLASMERRAGLQLRLQETVEGLSVVAVSYYALGLVAYLFKGTLGLWLGEKSLALAVALVLPLVVVLVWLGLRRLKQRVHKAEPGADRA